MTIRILIVALLICLILMVFMAVALRVVYVTPSCDAECRYITTMDYIITTNNHCLANGGYSYSCWQTARDIVLGVRR